MAGLWEFPTTDLSEEANPSNQLAAARAVVATVDGQLGEEEYMPTMLGSFVHLFSHIRKTYHVVSVDLPMPSTMYKVGKRSKWVKLTDFASMKYVPSGAWLSHYRLRAHCYALLSVGKGNIKVWDLLQKGKGSS